MSFHLLIVDDESNLLDFLTLLFEQEGYRVTPASSLAHARDSLAEGEFDLILCDIMMPDGNGMDLLREVQQSERRTSVIMMTAYTSTKSAIDAMKLGAYDYVSKPFDVEELKILVQKALEKTELFDENLYLRKELEQRYGLHNIVGRSPRMSQIFRLIDRVSRTSSTVLVHGESGTGKELVARALHFTSARSTKRFLSVNCGAMPENLLESELFGHERGAFTGAVKDKRGLFEEADGGTLFLDEIGEMPADAGQAAARAAGEDGAQGRRQPGGEGRRAHHRGHQPQPPGDDRGGDLPRGPLLPPQRHPGPPAAAARAPRGHPAAGRPLPQEVLARAGDRGRSGSRSQAMRLLESYDGRATCASWRT